MVILFQTSLGLGQHHGFTPHKADSKSLLGTHLLGLAIKSLQATFISEGTLSEAYSL